MSRAVKRNRVRIIGGAWRSRLIEFPDAQDLRPTPDRVRETLFNWLGQRLDGKACLDLFAGSGVLGFEALSRGARRAVMVEAHKPVFQALQANAVRLQAQGVELVWGDALQFLRGSRERFDVVFVDPPYGSPWLPQVLDLLPARLNPDAAVYCESDAPLELSPAWRLWKSDRAGKVRYHLIKLQSERIPP